MSLSLASTELSLLFETGSHVAQAGLKFWVAKDNPEFLMILPPPPECWNYKCLI